MNDEMDAAREYAEIGEHFDNPGGDWIEEAMSDLGLSAEHLDEMTEDDRMLAEYRVYGRAWELRRADEAASVAGSR